MPLLQKNLKTLIEEIKDPRRDVLLQIYEDYKNLFHYAKGSSFKHQAWQGGYADHITETIRVNKLYYAALLTLRPLPFTEDNATIALFFHDIEKPFHYGPDNHPECQHYRKYLADTGGDWDSVKWEILRDFQQKYPNLYFTADELNALKFTHGEGKHYRKDKHVTSELAAHVHHCDNTSSNVFRNDGKGLG